MTKRIIFAIPLLLLFITLVFFYPMLQGDIPLPGDLLVGQYAPYNSLSIDGYAPGAIPHKAQGIDVVRELFPWKYQVIENYKNMRLPFWTTNQFAGTPLLANFQSGAFYPLNVVFLFMNFIAGWSIFIFAIPFLSMVFMYLFLRQLGIRKDASIFSGVIFAFSSYMVVWMEYGNIGHTMLWLPFMLFWLEKLIKKYERKFLILFLVSCVCSFFAGYIQGYFYSMIIVAGYYLARKGLKVVSTPRQLFLFLGILLLPFLLGAVQLLPTLSFFAQSSRGNYSVEQIRQLLNPVWYLVTILIPDFFGNPATRNQWSSLTYIERVSYFGFVPFLFAVFAGIVLRKNIVVKFFIVVASITLFLSTDLFITKFFYAVPIPVLSTTVPTRILSLFTLSGSILAGFGLDHFLKNNDKKAFGAVITVALLFLLILLGFTLLSPKVIQSSVWIANMAVAKRNLILPTIFLFCQGILFFLSLRKKLVVTMDKIIILGIFLLTFFDLFYFFHKITPFSPLKYIYPQTPVISRIQSGSGLNRYWGYGSASIISNFQMIDHTYSVEGNDPLHSKAYSDFIDSAEDGKKPVVSSRADSLLAPGFGGGNLTTNPYRLKALNILGVKFIVNKNDALTGKYQADTQTFPTDTFKLVWQGSPWQIYENKKAVPRAFLTNSYRVTSQNNFFRDFYKPDVNEAKTVLLFEDPKLKRDELKDSIADITKYSSQEVLITTKSNVGSLLFLSDSYLPEWRAEVDGIPTKILVSDYAFRSVIVPAGSHTVRFFYFPDSFNKGVFISLFGLILSIIFVSKLKVKAL